MMNQTTTTSTPPSDLERSMSFEHTSLEPMNTNYAEPTFEQFEQYFNFIPKMMAIVEELPNSEESVILKVKDLYDAMKGAENFLNSLEGADLTLEQQTKIYSENLVKIKEKSELIEKYKTLEVFTNLHKLEEDSFNVVQTSENQEQK
ncbi:hypothetical protein C9374_008901 [Naegleria lovaniensis]|uniref:Mediator of RNA polymerase II transcription subunit 9 n=1 Tax=Naegleria lovaniensis TaxID=51637 RepID=A0AA88KH47_NAELO|nr:uncharacterized protein C9374_008901 [Naegleria lovaniensis]KAG2377816.1 hypothetical protein C9374_008901 [Naegleria lovaniensis]